MENTSTDGLAGRCAVPPGSPNAGRLIACGRASGVLKNPCDVLLGLWGGSTISYQIR